MKPIEDDIRSMSARWIDVLRDESRASEADRTAFIAWVRSSPEALDQFVSDVVLEELVRKAKPWGNQTREQRIARGRAAAKREAKTERFVWVAGLATAAAILLSVGATFLWSPPAPAVWKPYAATVSAPAMVTLEDGTRVRLSAATRIETQFTAGQRDVRMHRGEAYFEVSQDARRLFSVHAPNGVAEARGTRFNFRYDGVRADVKVDEGYVVLRGSHDRTPPADLFAGEQASLLADGSVQVVFKVPAASGAVTQAPERSTQTFRRVAYPEVAEAFNTHRGHKVFEVAGSACTRTISSTLNVADPQALVVAVEANPDLALDKRGSVMVIRGRDDAPDSRSGCSAEVQ